MLSKPKPIGGSDVAAILGLDPYRNAHDVYLRCWHGNDDSAGLRAKLGHAVEPAILWWIVDQVKPAKWRPKVDGYCYTPSERPYMGGEADGEMTLADGTRVGMEAKLVGYHAAKDWGDAPHGVPDYVRAQCLWLCMLFDWSHCVVGAWFDAHDREELHTVQREPAAEAEILELCEAFWNNHVLPRVPPAMEPQKGQRVKERLPAKGGEDVEPDEDDPLAVKLAAAAELKLRAEEAEADYRRAQAELLEAMGDGVRKVKLADGWSATKVVSGGGVKTDWKPMALALCARHGVDADAVQDFQTATEPSAYVRLNQPKER